VNDYADHRGMTMLAFVLLVVLAMAGAFLLGLVLRFLFG